VLATAVETTPQVLARRAAERMRDRALLLASLSEELSVGLDVRRVLQIALHRAVGLLGGVEGAIFLLEPDGRAIRGLAEGWPRDRTGVVVPLEAVPHTALALREARPVWFARAEAEAEEVAWLDRVGAGSRLTLPLLVSRRALGVFHVHYATAAAPPLAEDAELAAGVASQCALAIDRARAFQVERAARQRLDQGQRLTTALASARTVEDVSRAMFETGLSSFGALAGFIVAPQGDELVVLEAFGAGAERLRAKGRFAVAADQPLAEAFRTGAAIYLDDAAEARRRYPDLAETHGPAALGLAALPLEVEGRCTGALGLAFRPGRALDEDDRAHLAWLAQKFAQALERARLYESERAARERLERLQAVTAASSAALTPAEVATAVVEEGLRHLGASAIGLFQVEAGGLRLIHAEGLPGDEQGRYALIPLDAQVPAAEAARTRQPVLLGTREACRARYPGLEALRDRLGQQAVASLPLVVKDELVGVLGFGFPGPRRFGPDDEAYFGALASQCAQALARARGYEAERRARQEAVQVGRLQEQLMAVVGHDLRTPLAAIGAGAAVMFKRGGLPPEQATSLARIASSAVRMGAMIRDLLDFTRARQGLGVVLHREPVSLAEVARRAVLELQEVHPSARLELRANGDDRLDGDPGRLAQVVANLAGNALQHGAGSPVRIEVADRGDAIVLSVHNAGPPIPPEVLPQIFEPFRRGTGGSPGAERVGSIGLGLFIVREIVAAHGGAVEVRSAAGEGTTFTARFPRGGPA
jgi:signal transduction histidine kinase